MITASAATTSNIPKAFINVSVARRKVHWMIIAGYQIRRQFPHGEIGFDLRSMLGRPSLVWLAAVAGFIAGFYWGYRRGPL